MEEDALAGVVFRVEGELVVMVFACIDYVFRETEAVGPPGLAVGGDCADEKVACPAFYDVIAELDAKMIYRYFDDKLPLIVRILHRPHAGLVNAFAAHLHGHDGSPARLEFCPADADYRGGDFAVRLEGEFPAAFLGFPRADEKVRELPISVGDDLDAAAGRAPAATQSSGNENVNHQKHESLHKVNFSRTLIYAAIKKEASLSTCLLAN